MTKRLKVDNIVDTAGTGKPNFPVSPTSGGAALSTLNTHSYTSSATEPSSPNNGAIWWDSANSKVYVYASGEFKEITLNTAYPSAYGSAVPYGDRAFRMGGTPGGASNNIDYWDMTTSGNAADFGDLSVGGNSFAGAGDGTYGYVIGGNSRTTTIDYFATATLGNASDFGDTGTVSVNGSAKTNGSKCVYNTGESTANQTGNLNTIEQFTTGTPANATDFGDLSEGKAYVGSCANLTRMVFAGGEKTDSSRSNVMEYVTFDTAGNATDFGDTAANVYRLAGAGTGEGDRGIFFAGYETAHANNRIEYITVSTTGNTTDFGDLHTSATITASCNNATKAHCYGGYNGSAAINNIQEITMATTGNATDFGDLTSAVYYLAGASGAAS